MINKASGYTVHFGKGSPKTKLRRAHILTEILLAGHTTIAHLSTTLGVRRDTLLKDIEVLEREAKCVKCLDSKHVISLPFIPNSVGFSKRLREHYREKMAIARFVWERFIKTMNEGETIFLGSGTTTFLLGMQIACNPSETPRRLTIITDNLALLQPLSAAMGEVEVVNGMVNKERSAVLISNPCSFLPGREREEKRISRGFLGFEGLLFDEGAHCTPAYIRNQEQAALASKSVILMGDHTKIGSGGHPMHQVFFDFKEPPTPSYVVVTDDNFHDSRTQARVEREMSKFQLDRFLLAETSNQLPKSPTKGIE